MPSHCQWFINYFNISQEPAYCTNSVKAHAP